MDNTAGFYPANVGSIPAGETRLTQNDQPVIINLLRKSKMKARNIFAVLASKRKAGSHRKSNKALRRLQKMRDRNSKVEYPAFNRSIPVRVWAVLPYKNTLPNSQMATADE